VQERAIGRGATIRREVRPNIGIKRSGPLRVMTRVTQRWHIFRVFLAVSDQSGSGTQLPPFPGAASGCRLSGLVRGRELARKLIQHVCVVSA